MNENKVNIMPFLYLLGGVGAYLIIKPILNSLGITKSAEAAKQEAENQAKREDYLKPKQSDPAATKTPGEWAIIADTLYRDLRFSWVSDDYSDAEYQLKRPKNEADMKLLIKAFGFRQEYSIGIPDGPPKDLAQMVKDNLSRDQLNMLNNTYQSRGISFRF
jgi:hypothetical protein